MNNIFVPPLTEVAVQLETHNAVAEADKETIESEIRELKTALDLLT